MPWFLTAVLIAISAATLVFTGYLLRSVLTAEPATATGDGTQRADPDRDAA